MPAPAGAELNCSRLDYGGNCVRQGCTGSGNAGDEECCTKNGYPGAWDEVAKNACIEDDGDWVKKESVGSGLLGVRVYHPEDCWGYIDVHWCIGPASGPGGMGSWMQWISNPGGWTIMIRYDCNKEPCWGAKCWEYECTTTTTTTPPPSSYDSAGAKTKIFNIIKSKENTNEK